MPYLTSEGSENFWKSLFAYEIHLRLETLAHYRLFGYFSCSTLPPLLFQFFAALLVNLVALFGFVYLSLLADLADLARLPHLARFACLAYLVPKLNPLVAVSSCYCHDNALNPAKDSGYLI
jgi:hypothetical protein